MKRHQGKWVINGLTSLAATAAFLMILSTPVPAQRDTSRGTSPAMDRARERGVTEHEQQLHVMLNSKEAEQPGSQNQLRSIIEQTKQDFERIQIVNRQIVAAVMSNNGFDYKSLTDMTAEIRKRAKRLKDNVSLPPPADEPSEQRKTGEIGQEKMKDALLMLNNRIVSFVMNPLFQTSNLIDVQLGAKASRDLETIIELSGQIKKSAERLSKTSK